LPKSFLLRARWQACIIAAGKKDGKLSRIAQTRRLSVFSSPQRER
jgi:hypothetical protein